MGSEIWPMKYKVWHPWNAAQVFPQTFLLEVVCAEDPLLFFYSVFLPPSSLPSHHRYQTQIVVQSLLPSCGIISSPFTEDSPNKVLAFLILSFIVCVLALHCCMWAFFSCGEQRRCTDLSTLIILIIARFLSEIPWVIFPTRMLADSLLHFREN